MNSLSSSFKRIVVDSLGAARRYSSKPDWDFPLYNHIKEKRSRTITPITKTPAQISGQILKKNPCPIHYEGGEPLVIEVNLKYVGSAPAKYHYIKLSNGTELLAKILVMTSKFNFKD